MCNACAFSSLTANENPRSPPPPSYIQWKPLMPPPFLHSMETLDPPPLFLHSMETLDAAPPFPPSCIPVQLDNFYFMKIKNASVVAAASATHPVSSLSLPLQQTMAAATAIAAPSTTLSPAGISPPPPVPASANSSHERCGVAAFAQEAVADGVSVAGAPAVAADGTAGEGGVAPGGMSSGYGGDGDVQGGGVVTAAGGSSSEGAGLTVAAPAAMLTSAHQLFAQVNYAPTWHSVGVMVRSNDLPILGSSMFLRCSLTPFCFFTEKCGSLLLARAG